MILDHFLQTGESQVAKDMNALVEACTSILIRAAMCNHEEKMEYLEALRKMAPGEDHDKACKETEARLKSHD